MCCFRQAYKHFPEPFQKCFVNISKEIKGKWKHEKYLETWPKNQVHNILTIDTKHC